MIRVMLFAVVLSAIAGCSASGTVRPALTKNALLSGDSLFASHAAKQAVPAAEVLRMDDAMHAFVAEQVGGARAQDAKLLKLLNGMQSQGLLALDYDVGATGTVRETFHNRTGNCLSFTMLFVTLARAAGLHVSYEMVDVPPKWSAESGVLVLTQHINARIETPYLQRDYVVDFDRSEFKANYRRHEVSDRYALALFYSNRGAEALLDGNYQESFVNFKAALETDPAAASAWVNLGLLYSRLGRNERAESAYLQALAVDADEPSALTDLAAFYEKTGKDAEAAVYRKRIRRFQDQNPYYHYFLARDAYREQRFAAALDSLGKAIKLKRDEHEFYLLQGRLYQSLGKPRDAERSFALALKYIPAVGQAGGPPDIASDVLP
ncbi:MAG TPA: tetratricopeptide repeat protein [Gammaproteobacteria bacterium]|nr:tetratricopeptide repeat protein [Gammaproteobacteria bacterium]